MPRCEFFRWWRRAGFDALQRYANFRSGSRHHFDIRCALSRIHSLQLSAKLPMHRTAEAQRQSVPRTESPQCTLRHHRPRLTAHAHLNVPRALFDHLNSARNSCCVADDRLTASPPLRSPAFIGFQIGICRPLTRRRRSRTAAPECRRRIYRPRGVRACTAGQGSSPAG